MSITMSLFRVSKAIPEQAVPLTRIERLKIEIDECDHDPVRVYNRALTGSLTRVTEINATHAAEVAEYKQKLIDLVQELLVS